MNNNQPNIIIYNTADGSSSVSLYAKDGSVWMNQNQLATLFDTSKQNISLHIINILKENELVENSVVKDYLTTASDGKEYQVTFYSLDMKIKQDLFVNSGTLTKEDELTGYVYVLQTKSKHCEIASFKDLYKIGFAKDSVEDRIKNAKNEATYLYSEVHLKAKYPVFNRNADKLESLLHRFFANACLDIDLFNEKGQRLNPREWFVVPFEVIEETIQLILNENIVNYEYDTVLKKIKLK